jgi:hypothetical protein
MLFQGLTSYAMYGPKNKFNNSFSNAELASVTSAELIQKIKDISKYEQTVIYYGPKDLKSIELQKMHSIPTKFAVANQKYLNKQNKLKPSSFADYDMVQAEMD